MWPTRQFKLLASNQKVEMTCQTTWLWLIINCVKAVKTLHFVASCLSFPTNAPALNKKDFRWVLWRVGGWLQRRVVGPGWAGRRRQGWLRSHFLALSPGSGEHPKSSGCLHPAFAIGQKLGRWQKARFTPARLIHICQALQRAKKPDLFIPFQTVFSCKSIVQTIKNPFQHIQEMNLILLLDKSK